VRDRVVLACAHPLSTKRRLAWCDGPGAGIRVYAHKVPRRAALPITSECGVLRLRGTSLGVLCAGLVLAGCGSAMASTSKVTYVESGQVPRTDLPQVGGNGKGAGGPAATTVPLAQQNPTTALFTAIGVFQSCLSGMGVTFQGVPSASAGPNAAVNNPAYLKALGTCAAQSNIVQALKSAQSAQDNLTLAQIKTENKDYLKFRTCMIGKGWQIPQPVPNSKGLLFSFGGTSTPNFKPPPGQSILNSPDLQECASKAEQGSS